MLDVPVVQPHTALAGLNNSLVKLAVSRKLRARILVKPSGLP